MQVLLNLCYNAIKYTFQGEIAVAATMKKETEILSVEIRDTGVGIEPSMLGHVFNMFGLVERKASSHETGIGIGLYLCKQIVTKLCGTITMESEKGKGTKCVVELPVEISTSPCVRGKDRKLSDFQVSSHFLLLFIIAKTK